MPITEGTYLCNHCNEKFEAKSDKSYDCPCGKSTIKPSDFLYTGFSYIRGSDITPIDGVTYYLPEEIVTLSEKAQALYDELKEIKRKTEYKYYLHELTEQGKNGEFYLSGIIMSYSRFQNQSSCAMNELKLDLSLKVSRGATIESIEKRLETFLALVKQIEDGSLDVRKTRQMDEVAEQFNLRETKRQVEEYDYTYYV